MTFKEYLALLSDSERLTVFCDGKRPSSGYSKHYQRWARANVPGFSERGRAITRRYKSSIRNTDRAREMNRLYVSRWKKLNRNKVVAYNKMRQKNPTVRAVKNARSRIRDYLFRSGSFTGGSSKSIGLSRSDFAKYLESKFLPGMTWENYGHGSSCWTIDHIIPLVTAKGNAEELMRLNHYTNLQPMWFLDNLKKGERLL